MESAAQHEPSCPLAAVHRRLEDLHQQRHQAEAAYFHPDRFRLAIQTAIQTVRTVTFILQKQKKVIPDFETWHGAWQKGLKANRLMSWMVDARNKIEKEGDLEASSFIRASIVASYLDEGPMVQVPARLSDAPLRLIKSIPANDLGDHIRNHGMLRVERRWVENTLPDFELLDAVAIAYGRLVELLSDAHCQMGLEAMSTLDASTGQRLDEGGRGGRLPCMVGHADRRSLHFSLTTGEPVELEQKREKFDLKSAKQAAERYEMKAGDFGPEGGE